jgi:hypothetical protein
VAGAGWRDFVPGEVLTAANVQDYLQDQAVMVFASAAARTSALGSPTEGMVSFLKDVNLMEVFDGSAWKQFGATTGGILQVKSTTFDDVLASSTAAGAFSTISGLNTTITPFSTASKILVIVNINGARSTNQTRLAIRIMRGATPVGVGQSSLSKQQIGSVSFVGNVGDVSMTNISAVYMDSPNTNSAITYGVQAWNSDTGSTQTIYINLTQGDANDPAYPRAASSITLMEVAA